VEARLALEKILVVEPYHKAALELLQRTHERLAAKGKAVETVAWVWSDPAKPTRTEALLSERVAKVRFSDVPLEQALDFIRRKSVLLDSDKKGLNIVLQQVDETAKRVNLEADNIPLRDLLRYTCDSLELKYRVEAGQLIIREAVGRELETRFYRISQVLLDTVNADGRWKGQFGRYFRELGVVEVKGAKMKYLTSAMRLVVTDTGCDNITNLPKELDVDKINIPSDF